MIILLYVKVQSNISLHGIKLYRGKEL